MLKRTSKAHWTGGLKSGKGEMEIGNTGKKTNYTFSSRFEDGSESNPEELLGAAHAGCFSMALSGVLEKEGYNPENINTKALVEMEKKESGYEIIKVELDTSVKISRIEEVKLRELAETAKENCPVSKLFKGAEISVKASLA